MDYGFDASGSDDDLAPIQAGRSFGSGRVDGSGREINGAYRGQRGADITLQKLEYDAYVAVLRAFTKRTGAFAWDKYEILAKLREHLGITMDQHLEILQNLESNVSHRASREQNPQDEQIGSMYPTSSLIGTDVPQRKKKVADTSQGASLPFSKTAGPPSVSRSNKKSKRGPNDNLKAISSSATGSATVNPLVGRRVQTRWPDDNAFYEAQIASYNPETDTHALVYNANSVDETWEWVNVNELLSSGDLRFVDGVPPVSGIGKGSSKNAMTGNKQPGGKDRVGKVRGSSKANANFLEEPAPSDMHGRNWKGSTIQDKASQKIQLPSLEALMKQVDKIAREDDLVKIESVKRAAKEHEDMLRRALAEIGEFSDEEESSGCRGGLDDDF